MKQYPPPPPPAPPPPRRRIPAFHPVPVTSRKDGWTARRQALFIGYLAQTRSVAKAARMVSMGRESVYRLRRRAGAAGFAAAWAAALGKPHTPVDLSSTKATGLEPGYRYQNGRMHIEMNNGKLVAIRQKQDNSALLQYLARLDRASANIREEG